MSTTSIDSLLHEERRFAPDPDFAAQAVAGPELYERAAADRLPPHGMGQAERPARRAPRRGPPARGSAQGPHPRR